MIVKTHAVKKKPLCFSLHTDETRPRWEQLFERCQAAALQTQTVHRPKHSKLKLSNDSDARRSVTRMSDGKISLLKLRDVFVRLLRHAASTMFASRTDKSQLEKKWIKECMFLFSVSGNDSLLFLREGQKYILPKFRFNTQQFSPCNYISHEHVFEMSVIFICLEIYI